MTRRSRILVLTIAFFMSLAVQAPFVPFAAHAADLKGFAAFKVLDAKGKLSGIASGAGGTNAVMEFNVGGQVFNLVVSGNRFFGNDNLFFESPDTTCAGTRLMQPGSSDELLTGVAIGPPGSTVYAPDSQAVPQTITVGSYFSYYCSGFAFTTPLVPAVALVDLDTQFTPPFKVKP